MEGKNQSFESTDIFARQLPFSLEAEQSVLGAVLLSPECLPQVLELLKAEHFYRQQHQQIFSIVVRMFTTSQPIDIVTVLDEVRRDEVFASPEEAKIYLTNLVQIVPTTTNVASYASIIKDKFYLRSLITAGREISDNAAEQSADAKVLIDMAEQKIFEIREGKDSLGLVKIDQALYETYDRLQRLSGDEKAKYAPLSTGFPSIDAVITGLNKSDLVLLAARPGVGKTAMALNIATNVALRSKKSVAVFSLEMSRDQLVGRVLSSEASISSKNMRLGTLSSDEWIRLAESSQMLAETSMYIDDTPGITVPDLKAKLRRVRDLGLVVIDYLQLMSSGRRIENRVQEVSEITRSLKILAKELNVPVLTLSQLSRASEQRSNEHRRPMLSDLRESGSIEQDADIVMMLYKENAYQEDDDGGGPMEVECIIAKNRHGETGIVKLSWDGQYTRFRSMEYLRNE